MAAVGFTRYADDFVITAPERVDIIEIEKQVAIWLDNEAGLELSKAKIRIVNSTEGFEFLGFQIISIKRSNGAYKVKIHPSRRSRACILQGTREIIQRNRSASSFSLINLLEKRHFVSERVELLVGQTTSDTLNVVKISLKWTTSSLTKLGHGYSGGNQKALDPEQL